MADSYNDTDSDSDNYDQYFEDEYKTKCYSLRVPTASSIYPRMTPEELLSILLEANNSRPPHKRLPTEILLLVIDELHPPNPIYEEIHSIWAVETEYKRCTYYSKLENLVFDKNTKKYCVSERPNTLSNIEADMSAADLLYRMRCLFPNMPVHSLGLHGDKSMWEASVRHKQSGIYLEVSEHKAGATVDANWDRTLDDPPIPSDGKVTLPPQSKDAFITDALQLLNTLFGTVDGRRFIYYHPAAEADYPAKNKHFIAVRNRITSNYVEEPITWPYIPWCPVIISPTDLSTFKSLLPDLKYNIKSRQVDFIHGTADLTTILSSSQLFYRLLCHYEWPYNNVNDTPPITSVWQVKLGFFPKHKSYYKKSIGQSVIFMDDCGLFDIRAEEDISETVMDHLVDLVDILFSDECRHPYNNIVAGCVC